MKASKIFELHMETRDLFMILLESLKPKMPELKNQIKELEEALFPMPLLASSL
jgi:hypothetical protein